MVLVAATLLLLGATSAVAAGSKAGDPGRPSGAELSIESWPEGVYGYLTKAPARCAAGRRIVVFQAAGADGPAGDRRVAVARSGDGEHLYQWSAKTGRSGGLYAVATKAPGCAAVASGVLDPAPLEATERGDYPPCSPYVSEGSSFICKFDELHATFTSTLGTKSGSVDGTAYSGPSPWGVSAFGGGASVNLAWNWNNNWARLVSYRPDQGNVGAAFLSGILASSTQHDFTITDAFAQNDRGREMGDHFYTPRLPGQEPGQVGGPLRVTIVNSGGHEELYISGYLYLRRW